MSRVTSKVVLETLEKQIAEQTKAIEALIGVLQGSVTTSVPSEPTVVTEEPKAATSKPKVTAKHKASMIDAWQKLANKRGEAVYGYAYRKRNGKTGLWGCSAAELPDRKAADNYLGLIEVVQPASAS